MPDDWSFIERVWLWLKAQFVDYNGITGIMLYDEVILYDKIGVFKRKVQTKTNFSRRG